MKKALGKVNCLKYLSSKVHVLSDMYLGCFSESEKIVKFNDVNDTFIEY